LQQALGEDATENQTNRHINGGNEFFMALFRCTQCGHLREVPNTYIGKSVRCPQCKQTAPIYDTVTFVDAVLKKYLAQYKELHALRQQLGTTQPEEQPSSDQQLLEDIDIYNTTALAQSQQYEPILQWFEQRQIQVEVNEKAIDTSGFFDEVALALGNDYDLLQEVSEKIKRIQHKGYTNVKLPIAKKSQKQIKTITSFCQQLYDYSFVAKYFYQKPEKIVRLTLQTAPAIVSFFNGE
jgi:phage FluMu protein Com